LREPLWFFVLLAFFFVLIFGFVRPVVAAPSLIQGPSMEPTLRTGDRVLVEKIGYHFDTPQRGDVVLIQAENGGEDLIKRVAALPGETVSVRADAVYVDGEPLPGARASRDLPGFSGLSTTVPPGHVYVLGDNRDHSTDSRYFGPVSLERIEGEALATFWPLNRVRAL
jgi:signal peptidase I